jgi:integrase/recombinase XerD
MTFEALSQHLEAFLALKSARARRSPYFEGDQRRRLRYEEGLLRSFLARWRQHGCPWPIHADFAMDWVMEGSTVGRPDRDEHRLLAVRAFLLQVRTFEGQTGVPQIQFRRRYKRRTPYIFSDREIQQMMEAAVRNQSPFRTATVRTIIGLLASTGIRIGEALRLTTDDVRLDARPPHLYIHDTKFGKSRNVVLHPSTATNLQHYKHEREVTLRGHHAEPFFTNTLCRPLIYNPLRYTFRQLLKQTGITPSAHQRRPTLHSFRHTFAVKRLTLWQREGIDIRQQLPRLSVYLGHYGPQSTYWYLSATPELLQDAGALFDPEQMRTGGRR